MSQSANLTLKDINPSLQDFNMIELKKSKRELNHNAVKFRLTIPKNMTIRYEVVYKNLVRDLRKYFTNAFNEVNMMRGRYYGQSGFTQILSLYVNSSLGQYYPALGIELNDLVFNLGSLINPKAMLKLSNADPEAKLKVVKIFNYMYKFSLERLQHFLNNESLFLLLCDYMRQNRFKRIQGSLNMRKHTHVYYEACIKMLAQSKHR